jgi:hypothetical protein
MPYDTDLNNNTVVTSDQLKSRHKAMNQDSSTEEGRPAAPTSTLDVTAI